jgi:hypothetical protein
MNLSENVNNVEQHWVEFENLSENVNLNELDERCIPL